MAAPKLALVMTMAALGVGWSSDASAQAETEESNATTWIIVLLVLGTIIPMATWWVFSR